jgi:hypothetical protein
MEFIMSVPETLIGYEWRVSRLRGACKEWLRQDDFDRLAQNDFGEQQMVDGPFKGGTMILPFGGAQQQWLAVLQEMHEHGLIEAKEEDGRIYYRAA